MYPIISHATYLRDRERHSRRVRREERVGPTPETLAKLRPCVLKTLAASYVDGLPMLENDEVEAGYRVAQAYRIVTGLVGYRPIDLAKIAPSAGGLNDRGERLARVYVAWGNRCQPILGIRPHVVVEMIEQERGIGGHAGVRLLARALRLWIKAEEMDDSLCIAA